MAWAIAITLHSHKGVALHTDAFSLPRWRHPPPSLYREKILTGGLGLSDLEKEVRQPRWALTGIRKNTEKRLLRVVRKNPFIHSLKGKSLPVNNTQ